MKFLKVETPKLPERAIYDHLLQAYGLPGSLSRLEGERDQNFRLTEAEGRRWVVKVVNPEEPAAIVDSQLRALLHLEGVDPGLPVPRVRRTRAGDASGRLNGHQTIVLSYLPGEIIGDRMLSLQQLEAIGSLVARLGRALRGFAHPATLDRALLWDNREVPRLRPHLGTFASAREREIAARILDKAESETLPRLAALRAQVIHGDAHRHNVLMNATGDLTGVIDFGDMLHGPLIQDLANAAADFLRLEDDPAETLAALTRGYARITALEEAELNLLLPMAEIRLLQTPLIMSIRAASGTPGDGYLLQLARRSLPLLERFHDPAERERLVSAVRFAGGAPAQERPREDVAQLLKRRHRVMGERMYLFYDPPLHLVKGDGAWLYDGAGRRYLDCYNNVPQVGHCHPAVSGAIARQARRLNTNTRYLTDEALDYAERLIAGAGPGLDTVLFVNSGSEANDVAWRIAKTVTGHRGALVMDFAYHGITDAIDAFSPANDPKGRVQPHIRTLPAPDGYRGPYKTGENDLGRRYAALAAAPIADLQEKGLGVGAFMVDSAFMTNGILAPVPDYLAGVAEQVRAAGGLFIADEVQAGFGRMGTHFWGHRHHGVTPDFITIGKPAGNGHPIGAVITRRELFARFQDEAGFFSTFGGNNVSCAAGLAVLEVIEREGLVANATNTGTRLRDGLRGLMAKHEIVGDVRGIGLAVGMELVRDRRTQEPAAAETRRLISLIRDEGVLVGSEGVLGNVVKIRPPLVLSPEQAAMAVAAVDRALAKL
ncbi:MAG TPA: aminotransferase class III-fold pyridoxal phosphate-dependent enzyme [Kiloniellales bacterium]|nr:aminotransferase class III-fold pyridoxal phosphate-dependent enzyme [Kiloniellales bacterium]